ncbi:MULTISPECIES: hypothetical protein [Paenibacillus]|uniref:hypothetical protein n=1 Tax=Paenibacillus TaxID=44249 RepID=UPI00142E2C32|nr:hypothetical protein [Paenibacillus rhizosphaerae]
MKKKAFTIHYKCIEDRSAEIVKNLVRQELQKVFVKHGVVAYNLDEVLDKYIVSTQHAL